MKINLLYLAKGGIMINAPREFNGLTVVCRYDLNGETVEITTADKSGGLRHWKKNGTGWGLVHIRRNTGEIVYP